MDDMTNEEFVVYLKQVAEDFAIGGAHQTAADYLEAARRIEELINE